MTDLEKITASIIFNYLALHGNEQIKHTRYHKAKLKTALRTAIIQLQKAEREEFEKVIGKEEEFTHQISSNILTYVEQLVKGSFTETLQLMNMQMANKKNPKAIEGIVNKVLNS